PLSSPFLFSFFTATPTTKIYTLSLHDALPIYIIIRHILPNVVNVVIVNTTLSYAGALLTESGLSFLGFGVMYPQPSWGNMLTGRSEEHTSELQSRENLVCRLLLEKKKKKDIY